jgi:hypothetical protein
MQTSSETTGDADDGGVVDIDNKLLMLLTS